MALPSSIPANYPIGIPDVTIDLVLYTVNSIDMPIATTRQIVRQDGNGDYKDSQTRASAEPIMGTMELQREETSTAGPTPGTSFTYDYDKSGTASTLEVTDVKLNNSGEAADTFEIGIKLLVYQG